jgi:hypothetical protein
MSHFSAEHWLEFAGGTISSGHKALMQGHLKKACDECRAALAIWKEVLDIIHHESNYHPPPGAVRQAKAIFAPVETWRWFREIAQTARLIFDSVRQPAPETTRGSNPFSRQILQEAKPFAIDLRVDGDPARKWVRLTGQILNSKEPNQNVPDVEVFLLRGEHLVRKTEANSSGEFDFEFEDEEGLQLFLDIRGQKVIEIRLPASLTEGNGIAAAAE